MRKQVLREHPKSFLWMLKEFCEPYVHNYEMCEYIIVALNFVSPIVFKSIPKLISNERINFLGVNSGIIEAESRNNSLKY